MRLNVKKRRERSPFFFQKLATFLIYDGSIVKSSPEDSGK